MFFFTRTKLPLNFHTNDNCVELHLTSPRTHHAAVQTGTQNRSVFFLPTSTITCMCCAPESCAVMGFSFTIYSLELHYISLCDATPTVFLCCKEPKRIRCFHCWIMCDNITAGWVNSTESTEGRSTLVFCHVDRDIYNWISNYNHDVELLWKWLKILRSHIHHIIFDVYVRFRMY